MGICRPNAERRRTCRRRGGARPAPTGRRAALAKGRCRQHCEEGGDEHEPEPRPANRTGDCDGERRQRQVAPSRHEEGWRRGRCSPAPTRYHQRCGSSIRAPPARSHARRKTASPSSNARRSAADRAAGRSPRARPHGDAWQAGHVHRHREDVVQIHLDRIARALLALREGRRRGRRRQDRVDPGREGLLEVALDQRPDLCAAGSRRRNSPAEST